MPIMASSPFSLLLPLGSTCGKSLCFTPSQGISVEKLGRLVLKVKSSETKECSAMFNTNSRREFLGIALGVSGLFIHSLDAKGAGLPPEEKPKLCDDTCEKELENVPMVTTESGLQYKDIKVGKGPSPPVGFQVENTEQKLMMSLRDMGLPSNKVFKIANVFTDVMCPSLLPFSSKLTLQRHHTTFSST